MRFPLPLVDDEFLSRECPTAKVELTEADLRMVAHALSHSAANPPIGWSDPTDRRLLELGARRFKRIFNELRQEASNHKNGAAPVAAGPRLGSKETHSV